MEPQFIIIDDIYYYIRPANERGVTWNDVPSEIKNTFEKLEGRAVFQKMPIPLINILNGGKHADSFLNIQEFMIAPLSDDFSKTIEIGGNIFHSLKNVLKSSIVCVKN